MLKKDSSILTKRCCAVVILLFLLMTSAVAMPSQARGAAPNEGIEMQSYRGFSDVDPDTWYVTSGVFDYAVDNELLLGYDNGLFGPQDDISRGQLAVILHRIAGEPIRESARFDDVDYSLYYGNAILWARSTGVINGYPNRNAFDPDRSVTREEFATMLANFAREIADIDISSDCKGFDTIDGCEQVSSWARTAMGWTVDNGIITGVERDDGTAFLDPQGTALRCQAAKMITVFHRDVVNIGAEDVPEENPNPDGDDDAYPVPSPDDDPEPDPGNVPSDPDDPEGAPDEWGNVIDFKDDAEIVPGDQYSAQNDKEALVDSDAVGDVESGDIVVFEPSDDLPHGAAIKVQNVSEEDGLLRISGVTPALEEVYDELKIEGEAVAVESFILGEGIELIDQGETIETLAQGEGSTDLFNDTFKIGKYGTLNLDLSIHYMIDFAAFEGLKEADLNISSTADFDLHAEGEIEPVRLELGRAIFSTPIPSVSIEGTIYLVVSASGKLDVEMDAYAKAGVGYDGSNWSTYYDDDFSYFSQLSGEARAGIQPEAMIRVLSIDVVDANVEVGGIIEGIRTNNDGFTCYDLNAYVYLQLAIGENDSWVADHFDGLTWVLLDKDNGAVYKMHIEDGKVVEECTHGGGGSTGVEPGKPEPPEITPESDFYYEYDDLGDLHITGYVGSYDSVVVPETIDGSPVVYIDGFYIEGETPTIANVDLTHAKQLISAELGNLNGEMPIATTLVTFDASNLPKLYWLNCYNSNIFELDVTNCPSLEYLGCDSNQLGSLNLEGTCGLVQLTCSENNLTQLDVSKCTNLQNLYCERNGLVAIDLSTLENLTNFGCSENNLTTLDVSPCKKLQSLNCDENELTRVVTTGLSNLKNINVGYNDIKSLDLADSMDLEEITCQSNENLEKLDLANHDKLTYVQANGCGLKELNLTGCGSLRVLYCEYNQLTKLDLNNKPLLETAYFGDNQISGEMDFRNNKNLVDVRCELNRAMSFYISGCENLEWLSGEVSYDDPSFGVTVKDFDINNHPKLEHLSINAASIQGEELSIVNSNLSSIYLEGVSNVKKITIRDCAQLIGVTLNCGNIVELSVSGCPILWKINCDGNLISTLSLSQLPALTSLSCESNNLSSLDLESIPLLENLKCKDNAFTDEAKEMIAAWGEVNGHSLEM